MAGIRLEGDAWLALGSVTLLYVGHWLYGSLISDAALLIGAGAAILVLVALASRKIAADALRLCIAAPALLFLIVLVVGAWTLTPWVPGGPHPVWRYVGLGPGASTIDRSATTIELIKLLGLGVFFLLGVAVGTRDQRARTAIRLTLGAGVVFALWAFAVSASGAIYQSQGHRLEARFLNPNSAGAFFSILTMLSAGEVARAWRQEGYAQRAVSVAVTAVFAACLLATASRGAAIALVCGLAGFLGLELATGRARWGRTLLAVVAGLAVIAVVAGSLGEALLDRLFRSHEAAIGRSAIWRLHWDAFLDSPLLGYGLGTAETVNKTLITRSNYALLWNIRAILNLYLQWLEEAGLIGAAPMFGCVGLIILGALRGVFRRSRMTTLLATLIGVDVILLVHGASDFGLEVPSIAAMWAWLLGLQTALAQGGSRRAAAPRRGTLHRRILIGAYAIATVALSVLGLVALNSGGETHIPGAPLKIAAGYDRRAEELLRPAIPSPEALNQAARLSQAALRQFPYDTSARLRLAYVDAWRHRELTPEAVADLQRSYDLVPVDPDVGAWRVRFALQYSQSLTPAVRLAAKNEFAALWQIPWRRDDLRRLADGVEDPAGRLSLALWVDRLEAAGQK